MEECKDSNNYKTITRSFDLESLLNQPTRIAEDSETCIDHVFVRVVNTIRVSIEAQISLIIVMTLLDFEGGGGLTSSGRQIISNGISYETLNRLDIVDWTDLYQQLNASLVYSKCIEILLDAISKATYVNYKTKVI